MMLPEFWTLVLTQNFEIKASDWGIKIFLSICLEIFISEHLKNVLRILGHKAENNSTFGHTMQKIIPHFDAQCRKLFPIWTHNAENYSPFGHTMQKMIPHFDTQCRKWFHIWTHNAENYSTFWRTMQKAIPHLNTKCRKWFHILTHNAEKGFGNLDLKYCRKHFGWVYHKL